MRKPTFYVWENKGADQIPSNCKADQCLFFFATLLVQFLFFVNLKFQAPCFCYCTGQFVSDLVGNPEDGFLASLLI